MPETCEGADPALVFAAAESAVGSTVAAAFVTVGSVDMVDRMVVAVVGAADRRFDVAAVEEWPLVSVPEAGRVALMMGSAPPEDGAGTAKRW